MPETRCWTEYLVSVYFDKTLSPTPQGQDARDALLGRIFGCAALARSGRVADTAVAVKLVQTLLAAAAKKSFVQEAAAGVVLELLEGLGAAAAAEVIEGCPELVDMLMLPPGDSSPEVGTFCYDPSPRDGHLSSPSLFN